MILHMTSSSQDHLSYKERSAESGDLELPVLKVYPINVKCQFFEVLTVNVLSLPIHH